MGLFSRYSHISRIRKLDLFYKMMNPVNETKILDIGAQIDAKGEKGLHLIDAYPWQKNMYALNLMSEHIDFIKTTYPNVNAVVGDACDLPWPDNYFDIAYSNAVIEHVGNFEKQRKMASEIMRVAKRWFITTPNRWYPFEFHLRLPFITWLPGELYLLAGQIVSYNHVSRKYRWFGPKDNHLKLLTAKQLKCCFSDSDIIKHRITFMSETLIAVNTAEQQGQ